jgi:hypothetical protein
MIDRQDKMITTNRPSRQRGQILVVTAVSLVAVLGVAALSIDAAYMYDQRNKLYAAADSAAKSAAFARIRNGASNMQAFANREVVLAGLEPIVNCNATGGTSVCVYQPPTSGPFTGNINYVEVVVSRQLTATFFGKVLGWMTGNPGARSVAGVSNPTNCLIVQQNMNVGNTCPSSPGFLMNGCGVAVGGNLYGNNPNSCISGTPVPPVTVAGSCIGTCNAMGTLTTNTAAAPTDPLVNMPAFANPYPPSSCAAAVPNGAGAINPGCYTTIPTTVTTLNPGEYYVTGTWNFDHTIANGVFVYLAGGTARIHSGNNTALTVSAMSGSGTYSGTTYNGVAVFQERGNLQNFDMGNNSILSLTGAIYMPSVDVVFGNSLTLSNSSCAMIVAKSIDVTNGASDWTTSGCGGLFANAAFLSIGIAE